MLFRENQRQYENAWMHDNNSEAFIKFRHLENKLDNDKCLGHIDVEIVLRQKVEKS